MDALSGSITSPFSSGDEDANRKAQSRSRMSSYSLGSVAPEAHRGQTYRSDSLNTITALDHYMKTSGHASSEEDSSIHGREQHSVVSLNNTLVSESSDEEQAEPSMLPATPQFGCFVLNGEVKCYLEKKEKIRSGAQYEVARDLVQRAHAECASRYPEDGRWRSVLRPLVDALGLSLGEVMENSELLHESHDYQPEYETQVQGATARRSAMVMFNAAYAKDYHDAGPKPPPRRRPGPKPRAKDSNDSGLSDELVDTTVAKGSTQLTARIPTVQRGNSGMNRGAISGYESGSKKRKRAWKSKWPEAPNPIPPTDKTAQQIAKYIMQPKLPTMMQRYIWDMDVFTKYDGKLRADHIMPVLSAKDSNGDLVVSEDRAKQLIKDFDGWKQHEDNITFYNREGEVRRRALPALTDARDKQSGRFKSDPGAREHHPLSHHEALQKVLTDDHGQVFAGPKEPGKKMRVARVNHNLLLSRVADREAAATRASEEARKKARGALTMIDEKDREVSELDNDVEQLGRALRASQKQCAQLAKIADWRYQHERARSDYLQKTVPGFCWPEHLEDLGDVGGDASKLPFPAQEFNKYLGAREESSKESIERDEAI